jgi:hypothetical protein
LNMALEELRGGDDSALPHLASARERFATMLSESDADLVRLFTSGTGRETLDQIRGALNRRRYIANLVRDVDKELNVHLPH